MQDLTDKALAVLNFVSLFQKKNGYSPSIPEIREGAKINSIRGVTLQLDKLKNLGYIKRDKNSRRSIKILNNPEPIDNEEIIKVPLVGEIKAGYNALAQENVETHFNLPLQTLHGRRDAFLLRVKGNSMLKAGYKPGDIVIVSPQNTASNGDIVVALDPNDETATLKRFKKMDSYILLLPESDDPLYEPIIGRQFIIQGKVLDKLPNNLIR